MQYINTQIVDKNSEKESWAKLSPGPETLTVL